VGSQILNSEFGIPPFYVLAKGSSHTYSRLMACMITVSVVEESVAGNIGDDWKYSIAAKAIDPAGTAVETRPAAGRLSAPVYGSGRIAVPEHLLKPGATQPPPQAAGVKIPAGPCGTRVRVELTLEATEVDWLVDDPGTQKTTVAVDCPGSGKPPSTVETSISVTVREHPKLLGGEATFTVKLRLVANCL